jgi:hypothetical protein
LLSTTVGNASGKLGDFITTIGHLGIILVLIVYITTEDEKEEAGVNGP